MSGFPTHLWQRCAVITIYSAVVLIAGFFPACPPMQIFSARVRLDGSRLDAVPRRCQVIVSGRVHRCYLSQVAQSEGAEEESGQIIHNAVFKQPSTFRCAPVSQLRFKNGEIFGRQSETVIPDRNMRPVSREGEGERERVCNSLQMEDEVMMSSRPRSFADSPGIHRTS